MQRINFKALYDNDVESEFCLEVDVHSEEEVQEELERITSEVQEAINLGDKTIKIHGEGYSRVIVLGKILEFTGELEYE